MGQVLDLAKVRTARKAQARRMAKMFGKPKRYPGLTLVIRDTRDLDLIERRDVVELAGREAL